MNITKAFTILILFVAPMSAQLPDAPHEFWDKQTKITFALDAAAKTFDAVQTHRFVTPHVVPEQCWTNPDTSQQCRFSYTSSYPEGDPLARPFVKHTPGQVAYFSASLVADAGIAYLFHKSGHHKLERWTFRIGAMQSAASGSTWFRARSN